MKLKQQSVTYEYLCKFSLLFLIAKKSHWAKSGYYFSLSLCVASCKIRRTIIGSIVILRLAWTSKSDIFIPVTLNVSCTSMPCKFPRWRFMCKVRSNIAVDSTLRNLTIDLSSIRVFYTGRFSRLAVSYETRKASNLPKKRESQTCDLSSSVCYSYDLLAVSLGCPF